MAHLPTTQQQVDIAAIYAAVWNRAPDPEGFGYWVDLYANGMDIDTIADAFRDSEEGRAAYPIYMTAEEFVAQVYENVFNRAPDAAGQDYWVGLLETGYTEGELITLMVDSAVAQAADGNEDGLLFENKVTVGMWVAMDYLSGNATQDQIDVVTSNAFRYVTSSSTSVQTAEDYIAHLPVGTPYPLTVTQDILYGVSGNDLFQANLGASNANTLTLGDRLYGGDGWDTLDATLTTSIATGVFTLSEVEQVNLSAAGTDITVVNSLSGVEVVQFEDTTTYGMSVGGLAGSLDVSLYNITDSTLTVNAGDSAAVQTLFLDDAQNATVVLNDNVAGTTAELELVSFGAGAESLAVTGDITAATALSVTADAILEIDVSGLTMANLNTLTIDGSADVDLSRASLALSSAGTITVDASAATGNVDVTLANAGGVTLVATFGSGDDLLDVTANTAALPTVTVDMGSGDDQINALYTLVDTGNTYVTLTGGAGDDVLYLTGAAWGTQVNAVDFTSATVTGIETLEFASGITLASAADITFDDGFNTVDFDNTITFSGTASLTLSNLDDNATLIFSTVDAAGTSNDQFDLVVDAGGDLTFEFAALATFDTTTGQSVSNDWTFTNASELTFNLGTTDVDVTLDFAGNTGADAVLYADNMVTIDVNGGATTSEFILDMDGLVTESSDLTALTTIDLSGFAGTFTLDLGTETGVIENALTVNLTNGVALLGDSDIIGTVTGSALSDTYVFDSTLVGKMVINSFVNNHGAANSDYLDVYALGVTSFSQLTLTLNSQSGSAYNYSVTSTAYDGVINVVTTNGPLLASDFIFS